MNLFKGFVLAFAILCAPSAWAQCTKDTDCKGDRICNAGVCEAPSPSTPAAQPLPPQSTVVVPTAPTPDIVKQLMFRNKQGGLIATIGGVSTLTFGLAAAATNGEAALATPLGAVALLSTAISAPIAAGSANKSRQFLMSRGQLVGVSGYAVAGWTIYALAVINGAGLVGLGIADEYAPTALIISCTLLGVSATSFMAADAYSMRNRLAAANLTGRAAPKVRVAVTPVIGPKINKIALVGTF